MKRRFVLLLTVLSISLCGVHGQVFTPKGTPVRVAYSNEEHKDIRKQEIAQSIRNNFPHAVILSEATTAYNCHSYAWNVSEGGPYCWMYGSSSDDLHLYWDDGSYVECPLSEAEKIYYYDGDHSGVYQGGLCISKWGSWCLVQHGLSYGPASYNMNFRKYYKKNLDIRGVRMVGGNETIVLSVPYIPQGYHMTWTCNNGLLNLSDNGDGYVQVSAAQPGNAGDATLQASFYDSFGNLKNQRVAYIGINGPHPNNVGLVVRNSDWAQVYPSVSGGQFEPNRYYNAYLSYDETLSSVEWILDSNFILDSSNNQMMSFHTGSVPTGMLSIYCTLPRYGVRKLIFNQLLH